MNENSDSKIPKTQTDASRSSGGGKYPPAKTAVGLEDGGSPRYAKGEQIQCRVIGFRPGGFEILILRDGITGFLKSNEERKPGDIFFAQFDCWQDGPY